MTIHNMYHVVIVQVLFEITALRPSSHPYKGRSRKVRGESSQETVGSVRGSPLGRSHEKLHLPPQSTTGRNVGLVVFLITVLALT